MGSSGISWVVLALLPSRVFLWVPYVLIGSPSSFELSRLHLRSPGL